MQSEPNKIDGIATDVHKVDNYALFRFEGKLDQTNFLTIKFFSVFFFLATLVALHFTPVSKSVSGS